MRQLLICVLCLVSLPAFAATLWREGEDATVDKMNRHPWWYDKVKTDQLSGGKWISNRHDQLGLAAGLGDDDRNLKDHRLGAHALAASAWRRAAHIVDVGGQCVSDGHAVCVLCAAVAVSQRVGEPVAGIDGIDAIALAEG